MICPYCYEDTDRYDALLQSTRELIAAVRRVTPSIYEVEDYLLAACDRAEAAVPELREVPHA